MAPRTLILGGTGMLGHALLVYLAAQDQDVYATVRTREGLSRWFSPDVADRCLDKVDAFNFESVIRALGEVQPEVVINCIGIIKQSPEVREPATGLTINSLLPHRLALVCRAAGVRLIQISTDCVFSGERGNYREGDPSDARDLYGRTKFLGEVDGPLCVTIRTSIIGHELRGKVGLVEWFLAQHDPVSGYTRAIFSGFPTVELAGIIEKYFLADPTLRGIYHVSSNPISKFDLLNLVAERYGKQIDIRPNHDIRVDRSLDSGVFRQKTGYAPPSWPELVDKMYRNYAAFEGYRQIGS